MASVVFHTWWFSIQYIFWIWIWICVYHIDFPSTIYYVSVDRWIVRIELKFYRINLFKYIAGPIAIQNLKWICRINYDLPFYYIGTCLVGWAHQAIWYFEIPHKIYWHFCACTLTDYICLADVDIFSIVICGYDECEGICWYTKRSRSPINGNPTMVNPSYRWSKWQGTARYFWPKLILRC